jgi:hypothetical protein
VKRQSFINYTIVYIPEEKVFGEVLSLGAYASRVHFIKDGFEHDIYLMNEDFIVVEQVNIEEIEE